MAEQDEVRFMTFNMGLLKIKLMGRSVVETPPYVNARFDAILETLPLAVQEHNVDILALQEIYSDAQVARLMERLPSLPHLSRSANHQFWQFHNGLAILSKWPVITSIRKHKQASALEAVFASKSCLMAKIDTPIAKLSMVNMHTTAGGGIDPEAGTVDLVRQSELREAIDMSTEAASEGYMPLIVGDLNCGPEASAGNYSFLSENGFEDVVLPFADNIGPTWDPATPLNNMAVSAATCSAAFGCVHVHVLDLVRSHSCACYADWCVVRQVFANSPACRIDHVFAGKKTPITASKAVKVFTEQNVCIPGKSKGSHRAPKPDMHVGLSDHFGLLVHLRCGKVASPKSVMTAHM